MYAAAGPVGGFIKRHPTTKMLGLCFLILIGVALIADGFEIHIPRGYIYFAMAFAGAVEAINIWAKGSASYLSRATPLDLTDRPRDPPAPPAPPTNKGSVPVPARNMRAQRRKRRKK
jgi:hypothetical protein